MIDFLKPIIGSLAELGEDSAEPPAPRDTFLYAWSVYIAFAEFALGAEAVDTPEIETCRRLSFERQRDDLVDSAGFEGHTVIVSVQPNVDAECAEPIKLQPSGGPD
jgi:hypothetical protein